MVASYGNEKRCKISVSLVALSSAIFFVILFTMAIVGNSQFWNGEKNDNSQQQNLETIVEQLLKKELDVLPISSIKNIRHLTDSGNVKLIMGDFRTRLFNCAFLFYGVRKHCEMMASKIFATAISSEIILQQQQQQQQRQQKMPREVQFYKRNEIIHHENRLKLTIASKI